MHWTYSGVTFFVAILNSRLSALHSDHQYPRFPSDGLSAILPETEGLGHSEMWYLLVPCLVSPSTVFREGSLSFLTYKPTQILPTINSQ